RVTPPGPAIIFVITGGGGGCARGEPTALAVFSRPLTTQPLSEDTGSAPFRIAAFTWLVVNCGWAAITNAAVPLTNGVATEVPSHSSYWFPRMGARIPTPGAATSTVFTPKSDLIQSWSFGSVAATEITLSLCWL